MPSKLTLLQGSVTVTNEQNLIDWWAFFISEVPSVMEWTTIQNIYCFIRAELAYPLLHDFKLKTEQTQPGYILSPCPVLR